MQTKIWLLGGLSWLKFFVLIISERFDFDPFYFFTFVYLKLTYILKQSFQIESLNLFIWKMLKYDVSTILNVFFLFWNRKFVKTDPFLRTILVSKKCFINKFLTSSNNINAHIRKHRFCILLYSHLDFKVVMDLYDLVWPHA